MRRLTLAALAAAVATVGALTGAAPAGAAVTVGVSATTRLVDGQVVSITLAGIPAGQGVYVSQCVRPAVGQRAAGGLVCHGGLADTSSMIWASTDGARGSQSASGALSLTLRRTFVKDGVTHTCGAGDCAIFVYRDHRGLFDTSLDTVVPLTFLLPQGVKFRDLGLPKAGTTLEAGSSVALAAADLRTVEGRAVTVRAVKGAGARACTVESSGSVVRVRALRAGECTLALSARASGTYAAFSLTVTYRVGR